MKNNGNPSSNNPKRTVHRQIAERPAIQRAIGKLSRNWKRLDQVERGESLDSLITAGCSRRGLAEDLGQSETSIRRHLTIADLPAGERERVKAGKSAKKILKLKADRDRLRQKQQRIDEDHRTGAISDQLADQIIAFCKLHRRNITAKEPDMLTNFFGAVRHSVMPDWTHEPAKKLKRSLSLEQKFRLTRPQRDKNEIEFARLVRWLAMFLRSEASEQPILERALEKAERRRKEWDFEEPKTPLQLIRDREKRLAYLLESPKRRPY